METAKGIAPGIPDYLSGPLGGLIDQAKAQKSVDNNEVCGLFLFVASDWVPGTGWVGDIVYRPVPNLDAVPGPVGDAGTFSLDPVSAAMFMSDAVDARARVASAVCERYGWTEKTPWDVPVRLDTEAQVNNMREEGIAVSVEDGRKHVMNAVYEECMDLAQGFSSYANAKGFTSIAPGPLDTTLALKFGLDTPRLSAEQWLMIRGQSVLVGIGHSHPSGNPALSPEDFLATKTVEQWKETFQVRYATDGQKPKSSLELGLSVGNWIYAVAQDGSADSTLVRYDKRGVRGSWTGPF